MSHQQQQHQSPLKGIQRCLDWADQQAADPMVTVFKDKHTRECEQRMTIIITIITL